MLILKPVPFHYKVVDDDICLGRIWPTAYNYEVYNADKTKSERFNTLSECETWLLNGCKEVKDDSKAAS